MVLFLLRINPNEADTAMTEDEIRTIVDESQESGGMDEKEIY